MTSNHLAKFGDQGHCGRDMFLICHVILQDHVIQEPCYFRNMRPEREVTILSNLVAIDTVVVQI